MEEKKLRLDPAFIFGNFLLLFCALAGFFRSFLSLYGESGFFPQAMPEGLVSFCQSHSVPELTLLSLCLTAISVLLWSLRNGRKAALLLFGIPWAVLLWLCRYNACHGALLVIETIADLFEYRVGWFAPVNFKLNLTAVQELMATEQFLFLFFALLAMLLGWAIIRARRWWLVILLTLPPLLPGLLADIYPDWVFFLMLAACWCTMLLTCLCRRAAPSGQGKLTLITLPTVGVLLALITFAFPAEGYERPRWTYTVEDALVEFSNRHLPFLADWEGPFTNRITYVGSAETVNLRAAGPLNYSGRTVLKVTSEDYTGKVYLRGSSLAHYTGESWEPLEDGLYETFLAQLEESRIDCTVSPLLYPSYTISGERIYTITVENTGASGACVYTPYQLVDQDWEDADMRTVEDSYLARKSGQWTHTISFRPLSNDPTDFIGHGDESAYMALEAYQKTVTDSYTGDLSHLPQAVYDDFSAFVQAATPPENFDTVIGFDSAAVARSYAVQLVTNYLADRCVYNQNTPATPDGEDFVTYFLTESKQGYCMHFASAAALLLRKMGYPTRYVSGFTANVIAGRTTYVPDSAAHAWVEIYVDGYGWYPVEVTPSAPSASTEPEEPSPSESQPTDEPSPPPSESLTPPSQQSPTPSHTPSEAPGTSQSPNEELPMAPSGFVRFLRFCAQAVKWLAPAAAAMLLLWLGQYLPKRLRAKRMAASDTNKAVLDAYHFLTQLKRWGGEIDTAATELAQKARFSQHTLTEEERQTMVCRFDEERTRIAAALFPAVRPMFRYFWGIPGPSEEESHDHP